MEWEKIEERFVKKIMEGYNISMEEARTLLPNPTYLDYAKVEVEIFMEFMRKGEIKKEEVDKVYDAGYRLAKYAMVLKEEEAKELGFESREELLREFARFYRKFKENYKETRISPMIIWSDKLLEGLEKKPAVYIEAGKEMLEYREKMEKEKIRI